MAKKTVTGTKQSKDALGALGKKDVFLFAPEDLVLVDEEGSPLYDDRALGQPDEKLVLNILAIGVHTPISVRKNSETGRTEVVAGRRRVLAMREANRRLKKQGHEPLRIMAVVKRGDDAAQMAVLISENEQREGDSPLGKAKKLARFLELGRTEAEAAVLFGIHVSTCKNLLALLDAPKAVQRAIEKGEIGASEAYQLARLPAEQAKEKLAELVVAAPRVAGKRRENGSAGKAREILNGHGGKPSQKEMKELLSTVQSSEKLKEGHRQGAEAVLLWVMGDRDALGAIL